MWGYVSGTYVVSKNTEKGDVVLIDAWEAISIREWHTSSSPEECEYSGVLFCNDRSLRSTGSYRICRFKGMLYWP